MPARRKPAGSHVDLRGAARRALPSVELPISGYRGEFPPPPEGLDGELVAAYEALWRSPMGAAWIDADAELVVELVRTRRAVDRVLDEGEFPPGTATSRISGIEDKLGLSPKSRAAMHWQIVDDPPEPVEEGSGEFVHDPAIQRILDDFTAKRGES